MRGVSRSHPFLYSPSSYSLDKVFCYSTNPPSGTSAAVEGDHHDLVFLWIRRKGINPFLKGVYAGKPAATLLSKIALDDADEFNILKIIYHLNLYYYPQISQIAQIKS